MWIALNGCDLTYERMRGGHWMSWLHVFNTATQIVFADFCIYWHRSKYWNPLKILQVNETILQTLPDLVCIFCRHCGVDPEIVSHITVWWKGSGTGKQRMIGEPTNSQPWSQWRVIVDPILQLEPRNEPQSTLGGWGHVKPVGNTNHDMRNKMSFPISIVSKC